uniref:Uncharacterized protein n=1 Tax=Astatotilapia calliptera TaxID=8154 RepID=A0AAX7SKT9_ASTCA
VRDIKGRRSTLGEDKKQTYFQEGAASEKPLLSKNQTGTLWNMLINVCVFMPVSFTGGAGRTIKVAGLHDGLTPEQSSCYRRNQLEAVFKVAEQISSQVNAVQYNPTDTMFCFFLSVDQISSCCFCFQFNGKKKKKNASSWSHTACGFKSNMSVQYNDRDV